MFDSPLINRLIDLAIEEDYGLGDITTELSVSPGLKGRGIVCAKENLVVCGTLLIERVFERFGWSAAVTVNIKDGSKAAPGNVIAEISGEAARLITAERLVLNFLQHLSGIATFTRSVVEQADGVAVFDTRKTTPGLRLLEKYAVRTGGGKNHRNSLGDMILIKNNHIDACGGDVGRVLGEVIKGRPAYAALEVEVRDLTELKDALEHAPDIVMLDNMDENSIAAALKMIKESDQRVRVEVSGRVLPGRLKGLQELGVTAVSMGSLIYGARGVDISMKVEVDR